MGRIVAGIAGLVVALAGMPAGAAVSPGISSGGLEYVATIPETLGGASSVNVVGDHLYVTTENRFSIFDVTDPVSPQHLSTTPFTPRPLSMEMVDTNGEILLITDEPTRTLEIYDVSDPAAPQKISELAGAGDHTFACLFNCKWAYGAHPNHSIVDLRDPADPKLVGRWSEGLMTTHVHHLREVAPGRVLTASRPYSFFLDARTPARPKLLAQTPDLDLPGQRTVATVQWPRRTNDRFMLLASETPFSGPCGERSGGFQTWDATRWRQTRTFRQISEYQVANGTYTDGSPPANVVGCTSVFFDHHPRFRNGGFVAVPYLEHGTRLLEVDRRGRIEEVGFFMAHGGQALQSLWADRQILYSADLARGVDILRFAPE
jgi:hypothetical protein